MIVMKFGGTSVGSVEAFAQAANIVAKQAEEQAQTARPGVVVVTSAMSGVTNLLIEAAQRVAQGDESFYHEAENTLRIKHQSVAGQLIDDGSERATLGHLFDERLQEFNRLCSSIAVLGELTKRGLDVVSGLGERLSAPLLAAILRAHGLDAEYVDASDLVVTDKVFGGAAPLMDLTENRCRAAPGAYARSGCHPCHHRIHRRHRGRHPHHVGSRRLRLLRSDHRRGVTGRRNSDLDRCQRCDDCRPAHGSRRTQLEPVEL